MAKDPRLRGERRVEIGNVIYMVPYNGTARVLCMNTHCSSVGRSPTSNGVLSCPKGWRELVKGQVFECSDCIEEKAHAAEHRRQWKEAEARRRQLWMAYYRRGSNV